jgi:PD-(D/E)XK nuclease superfamily
MTAWAPPHPGALVALIDKMRQCIAGNPSNWSDSLPILFDKLRSISFGLSAPAHQHFYFAQTDIAALGGLRDSLRGHVELLEKSGLFANPWSAASLRRNEVRNASVLRWFLDPAGDHGCGGALLAYVLGRMRPGQDDRFPSEPSSRCTVAVEECPDGDSASRVDIQIDDADFFIIVEVKIDAPEQPGQLERYCNIAAARVGSTRSWAVIFLTTDGRAPGTAGDHIGKVISLSWRDFAAVLRRAARTAPAVPRFLATSFAAHVTSL